MKYLIWIVLAIVIVLLIRALTPVKRRRGDAGGGARDTGPSADRRPDAADRRGPQELMMRCSLCGVHLPSSDAVFARGRVYCSAEHRDADPA